MEFTGKITEVLPLNQGIGKNGNQWMAQEFVITDYTERTPKECSFEVFGQDKLQAFNLRLGDEVTVNLDPEVRRYNGKIYLRLRAWGIVRGGVPVRAPYAAAYAKQQGGQQYNQQPTQMPQAPMPQQQMLQQQQYQPAPQQQAQQGFGDPFAQTGGTQQPF